MENYMQGLIRASPASNGQTRIISDNARASVLGYIAEALEISEGSAESDDDLSPVFSRDHRQRANARRGRSRWASSATSDASPPMTRPSRRRSLSHNQCRENTQRSYTFSPQERSVVSSRLPSHLQRTPYNFSKKAKSGPRSKN